MAQAVAIRLKLGKKSTHPADTNEPVSFHLAFLLGNDHTLPENKSSVDVLRMSPNAILFRHVK
jgi:hypothetical protein